MAKAEHILLESEERAVPEFSSARKVHARVRLRTGLRRRLVELVLIDYYYLCVRKWSARGPVSEPVLDLRFVEPSPRLATHVPWRCIGVSVALSCAAGGFFWWVFSSTVPLWQHDLLPATATLFGLAVCSWLVSAYRTTRTLTLRSVHGLATILELTAHLGKLRALRQFTALLAAHLKMAIRARRPSHAEHLRDEMREHFRLRQAGILSDEEYESGKARILARHAHA